MRILLLGSGGREHAFAWKMSQSALCKALFIAPGNSGTADCGTNVPIGVMDFPAIAAFCLKEKIDLLVVGPDDPNVGGIWDYFQRTELKQVKVLAPSKMGSQLEGSKSFAKQFMQRHHIPTAAYRAFTAQELEEGGRFIDQQTPPVVLKADGLALGKGVLICNSPEEAKSELKNMLLAKKFGSAGDKVVVEQFLKGKEMSVFILTDGKDYVLLPNAKDYKRVGEGDTGLNTGGMGAISPVPFCDEALMEKITQRIILPTLKGLRAEQIPYHGFIYFGLMIVEGEPWVIEYNSRMGDPETQVVFPRMESDLTDLLLAASEEKLSGMICRISPLAAATVVLTSGGYPGDIEKGKVVTGLHAVDGSLVFHAGATRNEKGEIITSGGRVFAVTSLATTLEKAVKNSMENAERIQFDRKYYRRDIGTI